MSQQPPGKRAGKVLMLLAWGAGMFLATRYFGEWEQRQETPTLWSPRNTVTVI